MDRQDVCQPGSPRRLSGELVDAAILEHTTQDCRLEFSSLPDDATL
jgi:hypothetical protein